MIGTVDTHQDLVVKAVIVLFVVVDWADVFGLRHHVADDLHHGMVWEPEASLIPILGCVLLVTAAAFEGQLSIRLLTCLLQTN